MQITLSRTRIRNFHIVVVPALGLLGFASEVADHLFDADLGGLVRLFNLVRECNIPNWYASALLLACAVLLAVIAATTPREKRGFKAHWAALAWIFLYISIDETAQIHELASAPLRNAFGLGGVLYYAWVIPAFLVLVVLAAVYLRFLIALPPRFQYLFLLSAALYVGGAFGTEFFVNYWVAAYGTDPVYGMLNVVQEVMELTGVSIFLSALLRYLGETVKEVRIAPI